MKTKAYFFLTVFFMISNVLQAQLFDKIKNKIEDKASEVVEEGLNSGKKDRKQKSKSGRIQLENTINFYPGDSIIYASNFSRGEVGSMPGDWKTTGSGSVVPVNQIGGNWLKMSERTTYKLNHSIYYPDDFTIEFDLLVAADKVDDLSSLYFGFTKDNSLTRWISSNTIWSAQLQYMNNNDIVVSSSSADIYQASNFDLETYANQVMHVAIEVHKNQVKIFLDDDKIADTKLFNGEKAKHFFISSPLRQEHKASTLFSNFNIRVYKD
ncbi:MAG: hypothetical protein ABGW99_17430 [Zunongwangia sp.]|uniref:hypothetical protein n=1 Tax=Zunongwangia sp. TaxID=1965325 RepID=UPI0032428F63